MLSLSVDTLEAGFNTKLRSDGDVISRGFYCACRRRPDASFGAQTTHVAPRSPKVRVAHPEGEDAKVHRKRSLARTPALPVNSCDLLHARLPVHITNRMTTML